MNTPTNPPNNYDLGAHILAVLSGPLYDSAKTAILRYETIERERSTSAITELRDALDHMCRAAQASDPVDAKSLVETASEHLRRAAVEPAQDMVESRLADIYLSLRLYEIRRLVYPGLPPRDEVNREVREIQRRLENGRLGKAQIDTFQLALEDFYQAHIDATNLHLKLVGHPIRAPLRLAIWLSPVIVSIIGIALTIALA